MLELEISPQAENDLVKTWLYITEDQPTLTIEVFFGWFQRCRVRSKLYALPILRLEVTLGVLCASTRDLAFATLIAHTVYYVHKHIFQFNVECLRFKRI